MNGSRTVRVIKADGTAEAFDEAKLAGAMWRVMRATCGRYRDARELAKAIEIYLRRNGRHAVGSAAVFEMALKVLRRARFGAAAELLESHRAARESARRRLRIVHGADHATLWDKGWLARMAEAGWLVSRPTARMLADAIETDLLAAGATTVSREEVVVRLNGAVASFGLADAVPVRQPATR